MMSDKPPIRVNGVSKSFTMHLRGGVQFPVVDGVTFDVKSGECVVLAGPSGSGKSSILKMIYGNYRTDAGEIWLRNGNDWIDVASADARRILALRKNTVGYVSQFLRVIPRVSTIDLVIAAAREGGLNAEAAQDRAVHLLTRLRLPERLWALAPATFSGGEQQRVNIARGMAGGHPILLLDEPTASLDAAIRRQVIELIAERRQQGTAILGIFHDEAVRDAIADRVLNASEFAAKITA